MNYRNIVLALVGVALLLALLSIWIPWQALLVIFFLVVIIPSPFGRHPRQFIKKKIEAHRLVSEYERQRRQHPAQQSTQSTTAAGVSPLTPEYEQGYQVQMPANSAPAQPKQEPGFYEPQVHYPEPEQVLPPPMP